MLEQCEKAAEPRRKPSERASRDGLEFLDEVVRYAYARLASREEAEDVAMEVFQAAFRLRSELPEKADPKIYLIGIARRKIVDHVRRRKRERGPATLSLDDPALAESAHHDDRDMSELMGALGMLPDLHRDVLVLKYLLGFSTDEVGRLIGKSGKAANSLLQRARGALATSAPHLMPGYTGDGSQP